MCLERIYWIVGEQHEPNESVCGDIKEKNNHDYKKLREPRKYEESEYFPRGREPKQ